MFQCAGAVCIHHAFYGPFHQKNFMKTRQHYSYDFPTAIIASCFQELDSEHSALDYATGALARFEHVYDNYIPFEDRPVACEAWTRNGNVCYYLKVIRLSSIKCSVDPFVRDYIRRILPLFPVPPPHLTALLGVTTETAVARVVYNPVYSADFRFPNCHTSIIIITRTTS